MKILYHHRTASKDGQATHIEEMILAMRSIGCEVEVAAPDVDTSNASGGSGGWVGAVKRLLPRQIYELVELAYSLLAYRRLSRRIKEFRPDFIYERYNLFLLAGVWAKRRFRLPLIVEVNAPMALERRKYGGLSWPMLADWTERYVWINADFVLPVTRVLADHIATKGVSSEHIVVIPNAIREEAFTGLPTTQEAKARYGLAGKLVIGFTGFVREWDRLDRIVSWIARQGDVADLHLLVVGDGPARLDTEKIAKELGVGDRLTFTGAVARDEVPRIAMAFDIALQTALVPYASPLCLFEYLAMSKAIVAPDQPNHHEILTDRVNALLYEPDDPQGIERALAILVSDPIFREELARNARQVIAEKHLTWRDHAANIVRLANIARASASD